MTHSGVVDEALDGTVAAHNGGTKVRYCCYERTKFIAEPICYVAFFSCLSFQEAQSLRPPRVHCAPGKKKKELEEERSNKDTEEYSSHLHTYLFSILHILKTYQSLFFV